MDRLSDFRRVFAEVVMARAGCHDRAIRDAFARVPRHEFVGAGPWFFTELGEAAESADPALVYQDVGIGLERSVPSGLPSLHARCLAACGVKAGERVTHVGAGTGYFTAILAELVGSGGEVVGFEIDTTLAARAKKNLAAWPHARVEVSSAAVLDGPRVDVVYVSAGVEELPPSWLAVLAPGGRLLFPLSPTGEEGAMILVRSIGLRSVFSADYICRARFVPCVGTEDEQSRSRLSDALQQGSAEAIRSLWLGPEAPADGVWFRGRGYWLSTRPASS